MTAQTILPANTLSSGFDVANSLRFNSGSSDYLNRTPSSASNKDLWSISAWVKRTKLGGYDTIYGVFDNSSNQENFGFLNSDKFQWQLYQSGGVVGQLTTNRLFRDVGSWYHILGVYDSANGTAGNRMRLYINGVEETSFATDTNPSDGQDSQWNSDKLHMIGGGGTANGGDFFDGYISELVAVDGTALSPTDVGEFDSDSGIWKPIDVSGLTFGTNGFYLQFKESGTSANASGLGADTSGNTHHFTVNNLTAVDQSIDTCTNNFATLNPLYTNDGALTYSEGNLKVVAASGSAAWTTRYAFSTIGVSAGRWYVEAKCVDSGGSNQFYFGVGKDLNTWAFDSSLGYESTGQGWGYYASNGNIVNNESDLYTSGNSYTDGDIISMELDLEDMTLDFYKNGAKEGYQITSLPAGTYHFAINGYAAIDGEFNFGSPPHAISSGNADGNGHGNFEYAVPSGHFALCTKNLAEHG